MTAARRPADTADSTTIAATYPIAATNPIADATTTDGATTGGGAASSTATVITTTEIAGAAANKDLNPYFKCGSGFLAWALFGHIPLHDGVEMASLLFSEVKKSTSYGRGSKTRTAMRKAAMAASVLPVDNRRGKKREMENMHDAPGHPNNNNAADLALLAQTLEHLEAEALEKEEK
jgi:hypothetical protein